MKSKSRSTLQIVEEQVRKWQYTTAGQKAAKPKITVITISREPGSGGNLVAQGLADKLGLDLFHQQVIHEMAKSARVSARFVKTLDEKAMNVLDEWIAALVDDRHLWPDQYLQHLMRVVGIIGQHGSAVMVGRGANFIVPPEKRMRARIMAPMDFRIRSVAATFKVSPKIARRRVVRTESDRRAFIRKYFNADIDDSANYDLVINTGTTGIDSAVDAIIGALGRANEVLRQAA
jgi:cytidylate kinase